MAAAEDSTRSGLSRRDALRMLAASTGTVAAGSIIISQPAHADSGSEGCRYEFTGAPVVSVRTINQSGNRDDYLGISVSNVGGDCPCGPTSIRYAYWIDIPDTGSGGLGWTTANSVSVGSPKTLWENRGGSVTVSVGISVTCGQGTSASVRCRFATTSPGLTVMGPNSNLTRTFTLNDDNGNSSMQGLPACPSSTSQAAPLFASRALTASDGLSVSAGLGAPPVYDPKASDEPVDLGPIETTTTTTEPPAAKPADTSTTTSTSTTSTTTTSTTTPSTTAPPKATAPPESTSTTLGN